MLKTVCKNHMLAQKKRDKVHSNGKRVIMRWSQVRKQRSLASQYHNSTKIANCCEKLGESTPVSIATCSHLQKFIAGFEDRRFRAQ